MTMSENNFFTSIQQNFKLISLKGEFLGGDKIEALSNYLKNEAKLEPKNAIIDLSGVTFLNSMALGVLLSVNAVFHKEGGNVVLANPSSYLKNIFATTKLDLIFKIEQSIEDAMAALNKITA